MRDLATWKRELLCEIETISDKAELERLWLVPGSHSASSFAEEVAHVFDDFDIDGFVEQDLRKTGLSSAQLDALRSFRDAFASYVSTLKNEFGDTNPQPAWILRDPRWAHIMNLAASLVASTGIVSKF